MGEGGGMGGRLSEGQRERARKNLALFLQRLSNIGQTHVAAALGVSDATVHRWTKGEDSPLEGLSQAAAVLGLKIVPESMQCYEPRTLDAILELARQRMNQLKRADDLPEDEPE